MKERVRWWDEGQLMVRNVRGLFPNGPSLAPAGRRHLGRGPWASAWPACAAGTVLLVDWVIASRSWSIPTLAVLDEIGHLLTAAVILAALPLPYGTRIVPWALFAAVAIDVDHIPLYTFLPDFSVGGRPPIHSLLTVIVLLMATALPALRVPFLGLALGICLHFVRDVSTGPGVPMWWPVFDDALRFPYAVYIAVVGVAAVIATRRLIRYRAKMDSPRT